MKRQRGDAAVVLMILACVALFVGLIGVGIWVDYIACHSKWERSGMAGISYGPIQGCLVKLPDGRWLPEERIREIDVPRKP